MFLFYISQNSCLICLLLQFQTEYQYFNWLRPRQNGRHFTDDFFKCIFLNENIQFLIKISLKFVPKGLINNILALVQIMVWHRPGDKPLSEPMIFSLPTHKCFARPQWVNPSGAEGIVSRIARSVPWLLMPWLCKEPGHQQQRYWLCLTNMSMSFIRMDFTYLCHFCVEKW